MALNPKSFLTFEDWLEAERAALETRSEYIAGEVFATTGASEAHNLIVTNTVREISAQMKGRPCRVYANDMKVYIRALNEGRYPNLMALCGDRQFHDGREDVVLNPSLIVEVLSDSTEAYVRGRKSAAYREIPSLRDLLLISQHRCHAELYSRQPDGRWMLEDFRRSDAAITLESVECVLDLAEVYDKVDLESTAALMGGR